MISSGQKELELHHIYSYLYITRYIFSNGEAVTTKTHRPTISSVHSISHFSLDCTDEPTTMNAELFLNLHNCLTIIHNTTKFVPNEDGSTPGEQMA